MIQELPNLFDRTKKTAATLLLSGLISFDASSQVSLYQFTQSNETWTEITAANGGYALGVPQFDPPNSDMIVYIDPAELDGINTFGGYLSPGIGPGFPIGFNFLYNGEVFDRIGVSTMGWISFGKSSDGDEAVWIYSSDHQEGRPLSNSYNSPVPSYKRNRIAGFAKSGMRHQDLSIISGPVSSLRIATIGTAPNRVCVIQWKDFRTNYSQDNNRITFQIRLNETTNAVDVRWGDMQWDWFLGGAGPGQVGLGGQNNQDFNNRMTVWESPSFQHDWNNSVPGTENTSTMTAGNPAAQPAEGPGVYPEIGLNFRWSPPTCPPPAWPITSSAVSFNTATFTWTTVPGAASYEYVLATIDDPTDPSAIATGTTGTPSVQIDGLTASTEYFFFIRSICGGNAGAWSLATELLTTGGAILVCGEAPIAQYHCSSQNTTVTWSYSTSDSTSPVRALFSSGFVGNVSGGSFFVYDGPDELSPVLFNAAGGADLTGQVFTSTGSSMFMKLVTDVGSCETQPWFLPFNWTVGCKDCSEPLGAYSVVADCENFQYSVDVLLVSMGSASSIIIGNDLGVAPTTVTTMGVHTVGPFEAGVPVQITLEHPDNALCNVQSEPLVNEACAIVGCGPTEQTYCYAPDETRQWLYEGVDAPIGIRIRRGGVIIDASARIYDSVDPFASTPWSYTSYDLSNILHVSTNPDNSLLLEIFNPGAFSCTGGDAAALEYVVACHDGCTQPAATFAVVEDCANEQFNVTVTVTELGSTGTVTITNNAGMPDVVATALGDYTVGPFPSLEEVTIEVEGASVLCSWTSPKLTYDCTGVGIAESTTEGIRVFPNPSNGKFTISYPGPISGLTEIEILDVTGRRVHSAVTNVLGGTGLIVDLEKAPSGLYYAVVRNGVNVHAARFNVIH